MDWIQNLWISLQNGQLPQLGLWSYLLLAILVAVEGPIATLLGAAAASAGLMRPYLVFAAAAMGNLAADSLWYTLGYAGRIEWILRYGRRLGVRRSHLERLKSEMQKHGTKILLFAKLTSGFIIPSLVAAGLVRIPWRRWFPVVLSAEMVWTGSLVLIGYYAAEGIKQIEKGISYIGLVASAGFLLVIIWGVRRTLRKRSEAKEGTDVEITELQG